MSESNVSCNIAVVKPVTTNVAVPVPVIICAIKPVVANVAVPVVAKVQPSVTKVVPSVIKSEIKKEWANTGAAAFIGEIEKHIHRNADGSKKVFPLVQKDGKI